MNNNNIAGQTWQPYMSEVLRGSARPKVEGGYYIKYADPVIGYVDFIQTNGRYRSDFKPHFPLSFAGGEYNLRLLRGFILLRRHIYTKWGSFGLRTGHFSGTLST